MNDLEILHISDLHWDEKTSGDRMVVIGALLEDLSELISSGQIDPDVVIFSGDLAQSGEDNSQLTAAMEKFLLPVVEASKLTKDQLFIAPGNHDLSRSTVRNARYIEVGLQETLRSVDGVNRFIDDLGAGSAANILAVERMGGFYDFVDKELPADTRHPLLRCYMRDVRSMKVGVACFDTAWRATGEADDIDRNRLLIGERNVDHAVQALKDADVRLAVMHHPLDWLAEFDEVAVSSRLSQHFDVVLCGHTHRALPQTRTTAQGTAILSQSGSVFARRGWFNGYQVIKLNSATGQCSFVVRSYFDIPRRAFAAAENVARDGLVSFPFHANASAPGSYLIEAFLRETRQTIRQQASDHMNMIGASALTCADIKEAFVPPPLSRRSTSDEEGGAQSGQEDVSVEDLLRSDGNFLVAGSRETGKTSFLHYLAVLSAEGVCDRLRIPVVTNAITGQPNAYTLKRAISGYLGDGPKGFDLDAALKRGDFLFLIDNLASAQIAASNVAKLVTEFPNNRWICVSAPRAGSITGQTDAEEALPNFGRVRIGLLPRRSIRALTRRWSPAIGQNDDAVFDALMKQIKRDSLPRTGYMVTLLLWAMHQEKEFERVNEAILLSNVVDYLLGRADFTLSVVGKFDPRAKEITLEHLAQFLKAKHGYSSINDTTQFLVELFTSMRLPFTAVDALSELVKCGILDRSNDTISFKYPCFGEYFFASRMRSDVDVFSSATANGRYIENARELELLAGLRRQNADLLKIISEDLDVRMPADIVGIDASEFDRLTDLNLDAKVTQKTLTDLKKKRFTSEQIDDLMDAAERRATKRPVERRERIAQDQKGKRSSGPQGRSSGASATDDAVERMSAGVFLEANDLLARVARNSDFTDYDVKGPATRLVLQNSVKVCLLVRRELIALLDEVIRHQKGTSTFTAEDRDALAYIVSKVLTQLSALALSEQLSSPNVVPMAEDILGGGGLTVAERIFLCFVLQGCRAPRWHEHFSDLLNERGTSGFVVECVIERIQGIVNTQFLDDAENEKLHSVIDTAAEVLNWSSGKKGAVYNRLKQSALQADLRDERG